MELSRPQGPPFPAEYNAGVANSHEFFSCMLRHVGSDPVAERGRGEVNLSPIEVPTLRPRVGGFFVSGRLWEAQSAVFYGSGRLISLIHCILRVEKALGS